MKRILVASILSSTAVFAVAGDDVLAQPRGTTRLPPVVAGAAADNDAKPRTPAPVPAPPVPQGGPGASNASGA